MAARQSGGKLMLLSRASISAIPAPKPRLASRIRPLALCLLCFLTLCSASRFAVQGAEPTASQLAREARKAQNAGLVVRAWILYSEAARIDPANPTFRTER